jgi:hypothetical protein
MSAVLESRAEAAKLARLLGQRDGAALAFLLEAPADELRLYREQVTDLLYDDGAAIAKRAGEAARLLPPQVIAKIAREALGALLSARLGGQLQPATAVSVVQRLEVGYLAEVAAELDPRRAADVIAAMPAELVGDVAGAMARNGEHVAMGRFVMHLDDDALLACVEQLADEDLLRIAFVLEGKERIDRLVACLRDGRAARLPACARRSGLADELADLLAHLGPEQRARVGAEG